MMCRAGLICRLPALDSLWRTWSPEATSIGAVPFQDAKWALVGNRVMSPQPGSSSGADPVEAGQCCAGDLEQVPQLTLIVAERLCGSIPITTVLIAASSAGAGDGASPSLD